MKLVKMSLAAAVLLGASAFAIDNVKVSGDAKLFYSTSDAGISDLADQASSAADTALRVGVTGDLVKGVSFGATVYAVSTLGLENNLVANTWTSGHTAAVEDNAWASELWLAATLGKTTAKIGRMELDTPLAFSESWSVAKNTFDAAVLINQDLPDTTLVGAWVGKANGVNALSLLSAAHDNSSAVGLDALMGAEAKFGTFVDGGAYAAAIVNNSFKPATVQAWYYNVVNVADAYWLQADINCEMVKGLTVGAQYADIDTKGLAATFNDSSAYAVKLGYAMNALKVSASYSDVDNDGALKIANTATNNLAGAQSKLYTEAWWNYGYVGAPGAESMNVTAEFDAGVAKLGAYYTSVDNDIVGSTKNVDEVTLTASKSFGPLDATLAYVSTDADDQNAGSQYNTVQAYLTLNF
jgi:imipenem/basic amino acid-specific outer membrane pore